jgi:hypothetical protein
MPARGFSRAHRDPASPRALHAKGHGLNCLRAQLLEIFAALERSLDLVNKLL